MNPQDLINQNIRMLIGDLQVNLMVANARVQELEQQLAAATQTQADEAPAPAPKPNGKHKEEAAQP
jgi:hypothetical protein